MEELGLGPRGGSAAWPQLAAVCAPPATHLRSPKPAGNGAKETGSVFPN